MYSRQHLFYGIIFSLALLFLFPQIGLVGFSLILFSSVLIDIDHYIYYIYKKKNWNLNKTYVWYIDIEKKFLSLTKNQRNKVHRGFCFLHGIEFLLILFLLGIFVSGYLLFIFTGVAFHFLLDLIYGTIFTDRIDRFSTIYDYYKFKKLKFIEEYGKKK